MIDAELRARLPPRPLPPLQRLRAPVAHRQPHGPPPALAARIPVGGAAHRAGRPGARRRLRPGLTSIFLARELDVEVWATDLWIAATDNLARIRAAAVDDRSFTSTPRPAISRRRRVVGIVALDSFPYFGRIRPTSATSPGSSARVVASAPSSRRCSRELGTEVTGPPGRHLAVARAPFPRSGLVADPLGEDGSGRRRCGRRRPGRVAGLAAMDRAHRSDDRRPVEGTDAADNEADLLRARPGRSHRLHPHRRRHRPGRSGGADASATGAGR